MRVKSAQVVLCCTYFQVWNGVGSTSGSHASEARPPNPGYRKPARMPRIPILTRTRQPSFRYMRNK